MPFHTFCSAKFSTCIAVRLLKFSVLHGKGESKYRPVATNFQCLKNCCPLSHPCWGKRLSGQSPSICCRRPRCRLKAPLGLSLLRCALQTRSHPKPCLERTRRNCVNLTQFLPLQRETGPSRRGMPCCTYRSCLWIFRVRPFRAHPVFVLRKT